MAASQSLNHPNQESPGSAGWPPRCWAGCGDPAVCSMCCAAAAACSMLCCRSCVGLPAVCCVFSLRCWPRSVCCCRRAQAVDVSFPSAYVRASSSSLRVVVAFSRVVVAFALSFFVGVGFNLARPVSRQLVGVHRAGVLDIDLFQSWVGVLCFARAVPCACRARRPKCVKRWSGRSPRCSD